MVTISDRKSERDSLNRHSLSRQCRLTIIIIIIIIKRKDLGGVMSKDCQDTVQTLKTVTKRDCDAKERIE